MLSLFPFFLSYQQLSPVLIRLALAAVLVYWGYKVLAGSFSTNTKILSVIEVICAALLLIGFWTQAAALFVSIDLIVRLVNKIKARAFLTDGVNYYLILLILAISLFLTGPGWWAIDVPL